MESRVVCKSKNYFLINFYNKRNYNKRNFVKTICYDIRENKKYTIYIWDYFKIGKHKITKYKKLPKKYQLEISEALI